MKAERRHELKTNSLVSTSRGALGLLNRHLNTLLTAVLVVVAIVMVVRWRARSAEAARVGVELQLTSAQTSVDALNVGRLASLPPGELMTRVRSSEAEANAMLSSVINATTDGRIRARAFELRGDLYWNLANLPPLPGAATQPTLRPEAPIDTTLQHAADAYAEVIKTTGADRETVAAAHLGLAAVAENRLDWATAKQQLDAVATDTDPVPVLADQARAQLAELPTLQTPMYLSVPTTQPTALVGPALPSTRAVVTTQPRK